MPNPIRGLGWQPVRCGFASGSMSSGGDWRGLLRLMFFPRLPLYLRQTKNRITRAWVLVAHEVHDSS
jgi:hypothetical protein